MRVRRLFEKFDSTVCKSNLKMAISRARMCTNRLQNSIRLQRIDISNLLRDGREEGARLKGEHLLREYRLERAMEILVTVCELLISRMSYLATERTCPPDLLSPVHSLLYCEPRLSIDELSAVRRQLTVKYGEAFVDAALKNARQEVHFKLVHALSLAPPLEFDLQQLLCGIAKEYLVSDWKSSIAIVASQACEFIPRPTTAKQGCGPPVTCSAESPECAYDGSTAVTGDADGSRRQETNPQVDECTCNISPSSASGKESPGTATKAVLRVSLPWHRGALRHCEYNESQPCFPSLESPPHPQWPHPDSPAAVAALRHRSGYGVPPASVDAPGMTLQSSEICQHEDCVTPFHHEIRFGSSTPPGNTPSSSTPTAAQAYYRESNYGSIWEEHGFHSSNEVLSYGWLSHRQGGVRVVQQSTSRTVVMPEAAIPAYSLT